MQNARVANRIHIKYIYKYFRQIFEMFIISLSISLIEIKFILSLSTYEK